MIKRIYENIKSYFTRSEVNESSTENLLIEDSFDESYLGVGAMMVPPGQLEKEIEDETRDL